MLSLKWSDEEGGKEEAKILASGSCFFSFIFIIEVLIKLIGMGLRGMCQSFRNTADLLITMASIPWLFLYFVSVLSWVSLLINTDKITSNSTAFHVHPR